MVGVRLRGRTPGPVGVEREVPAHRAIQVLPRALLEARLARHAAPAAPGALPLPPERVSMARGNAVAALGSAGGAAVMSSRRRVLLINPTITGKRHARFPLA